MNASLASITTDMQTRLLRSGGLGARSAKIDFPGDGVVFLTGQEATNEDKDADCILTLTTADYEALRSGELNPTFAVMSGKLKVRGDMSMVMRLQSVLQP